MEKFRRLKASEIDARVSTVKQNGCSLLLYKDARCDMNILDETVGAMNWQRSHQLIGDRLYCTVSVWDEEKKQWISKQDVGVESYTEKEKGQASDSFKRACFNLGIGRELYTAPFIWISEKDANIQNVNGKYTTYERFTVKDIGYDSEGRINKLVITNKNGHVVYTMGKITEATEVTDKLISKAKINVINNAVGDIITKEQLDATLKHYNVDAISDLKESQACEIIKRLKELKGE
jgi:hypothetical protein